MHEEIVDYETGMLLKNAALMNIAVSFTTTIFNTMENQFRLMNNLTLLARAEVMKLLK